MVSMANVLPCGHQFHACWIIIEFCRYSWLSCNSNVLYPCNCLSDGNQFFLSGPGAARWRVWGMAHQGGEIPLGQCQGRKSCTKVPVLCLFLLSQAGALKKSEKLKDLFVSCLDRCLYWLVDCYSYVGWWWFLVEKPKLKTCSDDLPQVASLFQLFPTRLKLLNEDGTIWGT